MQIKVARSKIAPLCGGRYNCEAGDISGIGIEPDEEQTRSAACIPASHGRGVASPSMKRCSATLASSAKMGMAATTWEEEAGPLRCDHLRLYVNDEDGLRVEGS